MKIRWNRLVSNAVLSNVVLSAAALCAAALPALAAGALDDALAAYKAGEFEKAASLAGAVPATDPSKSKAQYLVGEAELARFRFDEAAAAFRAVLEAKKDAVPALTGLGRALAGKGDRDGAEKNLRTALELDAKDLGVRRSLAEFLTESGRAADALALLDAVPSKVPPADALWARARVEACLGASKLDEASRTAKTYDQAAPGTAMGYFLRALVLDRKGDDAEAIEAYEKAIAKEPRFLDAHKNLAILCTARNPMYRDKERLKKAYAHYDKYFELGGRDQQLKGVYDTIRTVLEEYGMGPK